jgi:hypothetical protein
VKRVFGAGTAIICWSAVGIVFVPMRSTWRPGASVAVAISSARP